MNETSIPPPLSFRNLTRTPGLRFIISFYSKLLLLDSFLFYLLLNINSFPEMGIPENIMLKDYEYVLPDSRIAKYPPEIRDHSKLLFYSSGSVGSKIFKELPNLLNDKDLLIFNDTKVIQARLKFNKLTGSEIEIFLLEPYEPGDFQLSFSSVQSCQWKCLVGNARKWKNKPLSINIRVKEFSTVLIAEKKSQAGNTFIICFSWENSNIIFSEIIEAIGTTPVPPYLKRDAEPVDLIRYQTVYSENEGSVAAPTAGLHFTTSLIEEIRKKGTSIERITLHVGAGTFIPVKVQNAADHVMHAEQIYLNREVLRRMQDYNKRIIAVGTTAVRVLESLYLLAGKISRDELDKRIPLINQWEAYQNPSLFDRKEALSIILRYMKKENLTELRFSTSIMIMPGYRFRMTDCMITNFHQPGSTLLLLVAAFIGEDWRKIYNYALENDYRFLSYGDSMFLIPGE
jgi:S-adenosylmethionine:tRNA ribosyltransferase-isomerase